MDRHIPFDTLHNFRDLGGYPTADGHRIRPRRLFRADSLGKLRPGTPDWDRFLALGIGTVMDLRHPWEAEAAGRIPPHDSFAYHNLSIEHRPYDQAAATPDVEPGPYLCARYMEVAEDGIEGDRGGAAPGGRARTAAWCSTAPPARTAPASSPPWSSPSWASRTRRSSRTSA